METAIKISNMVREYKMGETVITAVNDISFEIPMGAYTIILGTSGAGKSTVLNTLGGMDSPTSGEIFVFGENIARWGSRELTEYRRNTVGFVFQFYNLMPNLTVLENVELASQICKNPLDAREVLKTVGLSHRLNNFTSQLSGGEQQRVAIAKNPDVLLCDEPTSALDYRTGKSVLALLYKICKENNKTVIVVTHNGELAPTADVLIHMKSGQVEDYKNRACNKGYITRRTDSGIFRLKGATNGCKAMYRVTFNANIAISTGGTVEPITVALQEDGETVNNAVATVTPAAIGDFWNVAFETFVTIPCGCCVTASVKNISATTAIDVRNANIAFSRVA